MGTVQKGRRKESKARTGIRNWKLNYHIQVEVVIRRGERKIINLERNRLTVKKNWNGNGWKTRKRKKELNRVICQNTKISWRSWERKIWLWIREI